MALPSSGQISFSDLQTEYGGSNPISMSEFRGQFSNSSVTDGGPAWILFEMEFNSANNKLQFGGTEFSTGIALNDDMTIVLAKTAGTWDNSNLYFSSTTDPGNNNLLTTGVTNNGTADGNLMTIDLSQYTGSASANSLAGYIKSDNTTGGTAVPVYVISDPGNVANRVNYLYGKAKFQFADVGGEYVGGSRNQKVTTKRQITDNETGVLIPAGGSIDFTSQINALPTVAAGGTYHYIYFQLYDTSYDSGTFLTTFSNFRQIAWTNNVGFTNGSGSVITGSNNNATTVANLLATTTGYNVARNPNYTGTSENVSLQMTNSGSVLNGTITNNTGSDVALYRWQKASGSAPDRSSLWSLLWADSGSNFVNSHATAPTFTNHLREHYGYASRLRLTYYYTNMTGGSEALVGSFVHTFDDGMTQANCLNKIKTDNDAFWHHPLDTGENYRYIKTTVVGDSVEFNYHRAGQLRVVAEYLVYGYSQGVVDTVHDGATQGQLNDTVATFKSDELLTLGNNNFNAKKLELNMSMSDYYNGRGSLTLGSG